MDVEQFKAALRAALTGVGMNADMVDIIPELLRVARETIPGGAQAVSDILIEVSNEIVANPVQAYTDAFEGARGGTISGLLRGPEMTGLPGTSLARQMADVSVPESAVGRTSGFMGQMGPEFTGVGDINALFDFKNFMGDGDYGMASLAAAGAIPLVPNLARGTRGARELFTPRALERINASHKSREIVVEMTPDQFLDMAEELPTPRPGSLEYLRNVEKFDDVPSLSVGLHNGDAMVMSHEGRHRAMVMRERGVESFPVKLQARDALGIRWDEVSELPTSILTENGARRPFPIRIEDVPDRIRVGRALEEGTGDMLKVRHYTPKDLDVIDPAYQGTGPGIGAERLRTDRVPRHYGYLPDVPNAKPPESRFEGMDFYEYDVPLSRVATPEQQQVFVKAAKESTGLQGGAGVRTEAERLLVASGRFDGMVSADGVFQGFKPQAVTPTGRAQLGTPSPTGKGVPSALDAHREYTNARQADLGLRPHGGTLGYLDLPGDEGEAIARAYDELPHAPDDPAVKASYDAFKREILDQYNYLTERGIRFEPWTQDGQPYANSGEMLKDVEENGRLKFFLTEEGFGQGEELVGNPLLERTGIMLAGKEMTFNDLFRGVHDYMGHAAGGFSFGPRGEHNAWAAHMPTFSEAARPAMSMETRGQNSWVNFRQGLRREDGSFPARGDEDFVPLEDRPFAEQKTNILPTEYLDTRPAAARVRTADLAFIDAVNKNDGATFTPQGEDLAGRPLFAVAANPGDDFKRPLPEGVDVITPDIMREFREEFADQLALPDHNLGGWVRTNKDGTKEAVLDVARTDLGRDEAMALGKKNKQDAIFDLENFEEIFVNPETVGGAAMRINGEIIEGSNHGDVYNRLTDTQRAAYDALSDDEFLAAEGFVTNRGEFVSRERASEIAANEARMARAREQGFNTDETLYHATATPFENLEPGGFDPELSGPAVWLGTDANRGSLPAAHNLNRAPRITTPDGETDWDAIEAFNKDPDNFVRGTEDGRRTSVRTGARSIPVMSRSENPLIVDMANRPEGFGPNFPELVSPTDRERLTREGYDSIRLMQDGNLREVIEFYPSNLRSPAANFDPKNAGKNDLMGATVPEIPSAIVGAGVGATADEDNRLRGALLGMGFGAAAPSAVRGLRGMGEAGHLVNPVGAPAVRVGEPQLFDTSPKGLENSFAPRAQGQIERQTPGPRTDLGVIKDLNTPEFRAAMGKMFDEGVAIDPTSPYWYSMGQLRDRYIGELGEAAGNKAFLEEMARVSASSPRNDILTNIRYASRKSDPMGMRQGFQDEVGEGILPPDWPLTRPKQRDFFENLVGNLDVGTIDSHVLKRMADARGLDQNALLNARTTGGRYASLEDAHNAAAADAGVQPGIFQPPVWITSPTVSDTKPLLSIYEGEITRRAKEMGMSKESFLRGLTRGDFTLAATGLFAGQAVHRGVGGLFGDPNRER